MNGKTLMENSIIITIYKEFMKKSNFPVTNFLKHIYTSYYSCI